LSILNLEFSSRAVAAPDATENWDATFRDVLKNDNPREPRETLARANPNIILPLESASPLSQLVILGLLQRLTLAVYKAPPNEESLLDLALQQGRRGSHLFQQTLWWLQRAASALFLSAESTDLVIASEAARIVPNVQRMLTKTRERCSGLPTDHPVQKAAATISQIQEIIVRNFGPEDIAQRGQHYICSNLSEDDLANIPGV